MSADWSLEDMQTGKARPTPLLDDLRALAHRWKTQPNGPFLAHAGLFESQVDAEDLLARLNGIRRVDDPGEVLEAAQAFAKLDRVARSEELRKVLVPYEQGPLPPPFPKR